MTKQDGLLLNILEVAADSIHEGAVVLDSTRKIIAINNKAAKLLDLSSDVPSLVGKDFNVVIKHLPALKRIIDSNVVRFKPTPKTKRIFELETNLGKKIISVLGHTVNGGCLLIIEDIEAGVEVEQIKNEFVSMTSHQLRTPLTAIRWYLEELLEGRIGPLTKAQRVYLDYSLQSAVRLIKLVKSLLNISYLEQKRLIINPQPTDLLHLIQEVVAEHRPLAQAKNCSIILDVTKLNLKKIKIDEALIRQVIVNLLSNAIKYSTGLKKEKTRVIVKLAKTPKKVIVSITDSGIGVPHSLRHNIFKKFFRADNVFKLEAEGTGLGLYIAKLIVEASGGAIWFESEENKGSTFTFSLPLKGSKKRHGERILV